jgi:hypothetical protein
VTTHDVRLLRLLIGGLVAGAVLLMTTLVLAFPTTASWHTSPTLVGGKPGAGGIYGTGGQSDHGITCAVCHINAAGQIGASFSVSPAWAKVGGQDAYQPGTTYQITVNLTGEHLGVGTTTNQNGMNLTIEDVSGKPVGTFTSDTGVTSSACPSSFPATAPTGTTYLFGDCHGVLFIQKTGSGNTTWKFSWTAPPAGTGTVTAYYGLVDGKDPGGKSCLDDDVKVGTFKLQEQ